MSTGAWTTGIGSRSHLREHNLEWQRRARCHGKEPAVFYPEKGGANHALDAKRICTGCPVRDACLEYALTHREQGVWGGLTEQERRELAAARRRNAAWRRVNA